MRDKVFYILERDNRQKDSALNHVLLKHLKQTKQQVIWEDPAGEFLYKVRKFEIKYFKNATESTKHFILRGAQIIYGLVHWDYYIYISKRRNNTPSNIKKNLTEELKKLHIYNDIIIMSRSAGGRFASSVADELNIKHIICLSYPFQNPNNGVEPDRFIHLENLKTPMTIFQGDKDEYGGLEVIDKYKLSNNINLQFVNANHDFNISDKEWNKVLAQIDTIIKTV